MSSMSELIDFLMGLMRSDEAQTAFEQDPEGTLARNGLEGVTSQDVRDARLMMRDDGGIRPQGTDTSARHDDPVREIRHTTQNYEVDKNYTVNDVDQTFNLFNIDDRDTVIEDSFNSNDNNDIRTVAIQDNDTVNDNDVNVEDSFNDEISAPSGDLPTPVGSGQFQDPIVSIDPVEDAPGDQPFTGEPLADDPIVSIDPVEETPVHEPIEDEPELVHTDAAIV